MLKHDRAFSYPIAGKVVESSSAKLHVVGEEVFIVFVRKGENLKNFLVFDKTGTPCYRSGDIRFCHGERFDGVGVFAWSCVTDGGTEHRVTLSLEEVDSERGRRYYPEWLWKEIFSRRLAG
jgi:hypothetical protein